MRRSIPRKGPWSRRQLDGFLDDVKVPLRIAGIGSSGYPVIASLWFTRAEDVIGSRGSNLARNLLSKSANETAIAIEPQSLLTWDFRERMGGL